MAFSLLWSLGFIISIMIFSVAIGLIISYENISKIDLAKFSIASLICTFILIYAINIFKVQLISAIGDYSFLLLFVISLLLMFSGYLFNKGKNNTKKVILLSYLSFMLLALICICTKGSLLGLNSLYISLFTTILFNLIIIGVVYFCKKFNFMNISDNSLGSMYFILGIYSLMVSLLLPNIISLNMKDMKPINIVSIEYILVTIALLIVVIVLGLLYYKKNTLLK